MYPIYGNLSRLNHVPQKITPNDLTIIEPTAKPGFLNRKPLFEVKGGAFPRPPCYGSTGTSKSEVHDFGQQFCVYCLDAKQQSFHHLYLYICMTYDIRNKNIDWSKSGILNLHLYTCPVKINPVKFQSSLCNQGSSRYTKVSLNHRSALAAGQLKKELVNGPTCLKFKGI